jgi:hypothetical protein
MIYKWNERMLLMNRKTKTKFLQNDDEKTSFEIKEVFLQTNYKWQNNDVKTSFETKESLE